MQDIDIKELSNIKEELEELGEEEVIFINDGEEAKYALMPVEYFNTLEAYREILDTNYNPSDVKIISNMVDNISYDEYETIKKQLIDVFDKTFKPKPEKLN